MSDDPKAKLDSSKVEQVKKFINLAASPNLAEAKNAAYKACQLIRQLGLDIVDPDAINQVFVELADAQKQVKQLAAGVARPPAADSSLTLDSFTQAYNAAVGQAAARVGQAAARNPPPFMGSRTRATSPVDVNDILRDLHGIPMKPDPSPMTAPVTIKTDYDRQSCLYCKRSIRRGEKARWMKGIGIWCDLPSDCYKNWTAGKQPAPFVGDLSDLFK